MKDSSRDRLQGPAVLLVWAAVTTCAVGFVYLNGGAGKVALSFWPGWEPRALPVVLVVFGGFLAGFLTAVVLATVTVLRRGAEHRALRRRISSLEQELQRLRNLPIEEDLHAPLEADPGETERS
jgi:uncharacterized integral membrane protein